MARPFKVAKVSGSPKFHPRSYQADGIKFILENPHCGLFYPPGLGKTATTLAAFKVLKDGGYVDKMFIIAPLRVCHMVWPAEVKDWLDFEHLSVGVLHGAKKDQVLNEDHDIYVMNPEGIKWLEANQKIFIKERWVLTLDESTLWKNATSQRFKKLKKMIHHFDRRLLLTGTPVPRGLINLWSQLFLLDGGRRLGKYITGFRNKYFYPTGYMGYDYQLQDGAEDKIYGAIEDVILHKSLDELDLPERSYNTIKVRLPAAAMAVYEDMRKEMVAWLAEQGELLTAMSAATVTGKLKQISNGGTYLPDGSVAHLHDAKTEAVQELVESLGGRPLLVLYEYKHDLARLQAAFPDAPHIGGGVGTKKSAAICDDWNRSNLTVLLAQVQSLSHGLNLQKGTCQDVCWYSITYDRELYDQANARVWRQGVKNAVVVHHVVAEDTIDKAIMGLLKKKGKVQDALLHYLL